MKIISEKIAIVKCQSDVNTSVKLSKINNSIIELVKACSLSNQWEKTSSEVYFVLSFLSITRAKENQIIIDGGNQSIQELLQNIRVSFVRLLKVVSQTKETNYLGDDIGDIYDLLELLELEN